MTSNAPHDDSNDDGNERPPSAQPSNTNGQEGGSNEGGHPLPAENEEEIGDGSEDDSDGHDDEEDANNENTDDDNDDDHPPFTIPSHPFPYSSSVEPAEPAYRRYQRRLPVPPSVDRVSLDLSGTWYHEIREHVRQQERERIPTPVFVHHQRDEARRNAQVRHTRITRAQVIHVISPAERAFWYNRSYFNFVNRVTASRSWSFYAYCYYSVVLAAYVVMDDLRVWRRLYGTPGAVAVAALARKQVWRLQARVLAGAVEGVGGFGDLKRLGEDTGTGDYKREGVGQGKDGVGIGNGERGYDGSWVRVSTSRRRSGPGSAGETGAVEEKVEEKAEEKVEEKVEEKAENEKLQEAADYNHESQTTSPAPKEPDPVPRTRLFHHHIRLESDGFSVASLEFKKAVESESQRVSTSVRSSLPASIKPP